MHITIRKNKSSPRLPCSWFKALARFFETDSSMATLSRHCRIVEGHQPIAEDVTIVQC